MRLKTEIKFIITHFHLKIEINFKLHTKFYVNLFANDIIQIFRDNNSINNLQETVNQELQTIDEWIKVNQLLFDYIKSNHFISVSRHQSFFQQNLHRFW